MSSMTTDELELAFRAHASELRSFLHRQLRNPEAAADLTQETYLRLLRQPPRKPVLNLRGFIFKIARQCSFLIFICVGIFLVRLNDFLKQQLPQKTTILWNRFEGIHVFLSVK